MTDIAISVENLSKQYRIGGPQARYKTIRESLTEAVQSPFRRLASVVRGQSSAAANETIWALKDVSFEVQRGEVVGIIGRNGAGKTTLLKILSRITEPTEGHAEIHGRVGSLLEVGTGFHPELTGRENITLNGAILGMKRAEIERKFDEIVDFSGIEKFIDTPVKHYSSGMYVRLAFAVAAHLDPEILLVDEVLSVGDAEFQKKCLGKMGEVARGGRTVLFVSHNLGAIKSLCTKGVLLKSGKLEYLGNVDNAIATYMGIAESKYRFENPRTETKRDEIIHVNEISLDVSGQDDKPFFTYADEIIIRAKVSIYEYHADLVAGLALNNSDGLCVLKTYLNDCLDNESLLPGEYNFKIVIDSHLLSKGKYSITYGSYLYNGSVELEAYRDVLLFEIVQSDNEIKSYNISPAVIAKKIPWLVESYSELE